MYPEEPDQMGNMKYRHLLLYHRFTADIKEELKKTLGTQARVTQHIVCMRKHFNIGNQRGKGKFGRHEVPNRFPELLYWPKSTLYKPDPTPGITMFTTAPVGGAAQSAGRTPPEGATPVTPVGSGTPLPPSKRFLKTQEEDPGTLPDLVAGGGGGPEPMNVDDIPGTGETPGGVSDPGWGEDSVVAGLSKTIGSMTVESEPILREDIENIDSEQIPGFIDKFVKNLGTAATTSVSIPPSLTPSIATAASGTNENKGTATSSGETGLKIANVRSLVQPVKSSSLPPVPTARKRTMGPPKRIKPTFLGAQVTTSSLTPPSNDENFYKEYIPTLMYQYNLAYEEKKEEDMKVLQEMLQAPIRVYMNWSSGGILPRSW